MWWLSGIIDCGGSGTDVYLISINILKLLFMCICGYVNMCVGHGGQKRVLVLDLPTRARFTGCMGTGN